MARTNFQYGVWSWGAPVLPQGPFVGFGGAGGGNSTSGPITQSHVYFVNSAAPLAADAGNHGLTPNLPFKTLNFALTQTFNNNNDVIYVGPLHVETVVAAGGLTFPTATAAGVTVIMLGSGTNQATVNFTTLTTASVTIPASGVTWIGPRFTNGIDALATGVSITGAYCSLQNVVWVDALANATAIQVITTAAANYLNINGYTYTLAGTITGTEPTEAIRLVGGTGAVMRNLNIQGQFSTACVNNITTAFTNLMMENSYLSNQDAAPHPAWAFLTTSTGFAEHVTLGIASGATYNTGSNKISFDVTSSGVVPGAGSATLS